MKKIKYGLSVLALFLLTVCHYTASAQIIEVRDNDMNVSFLGGTYPVSFVIKSAFENFPQDTGFEISKMKTRGDDIDFSILYIGAPTEPVYSGGYYNHEFEAMFRFGENTSFESLEARYRIFLEAYRNGQSYSYHFDVDIERETKAQAMGAISPLRSTVHSGRSATLTHTGTMAGKSGNRWQERLSTEIEWRDIPGASGTTYTRTFTNTGMEDITYYYRVEVTYNNQKVATNPSTVTVVPAPRPGTVMPLSQEANASNLRPLVHYESLQSTSIQWQRLNGSTWSDLAGETRPYYNHPPNSTAGTYQYRVKVNTTAGTVIYTPAAKIIYSTGTAASDLSGGSIAPASQNVNSGSSASALSVSGVTGGGSGTITYQWQRSTDGIRYTNVTGGTSTNYSPGSITADTYFRVAVTRGGQTAYSNYAIVTVANAALKAGEATPAAQKILSGTQPLSLTASGASGGNGTYAYQWQRSTSANGTFTDVSGANKIAYAPGTATQNYYYRVKVTSGTATAYSASAAVEVQAATNPGLATMPTTENSIVKTVPRTAGTTVPTTVTTAMISVAYYDGLGRPKQSIEMGASPTRKDIVTHIEYDNMGRGDAKSYLPYTAASSGGGVQTNAATAQRTFYTSLFGSSHANRAFVERTYERSPLSRVQQEARPGDIYGRTMYRDETTRTDVSAAVKYTYGGNTNSDAVYCFSVNTAGNITLAKYYLPNTLHKTVIEDEDRLCTVTFTDMAGRTVLERRYHTYLPEILYDTYYLYDEPGRLRWVLSPEASAGITSFGVTYTGEETFLKELAYKYTYDARGNLTQKRLPGADPILIVYDKIDRPVAEQTGADKTAARWIMTGYDPHNRVTGQRQAGNYSETQMRASYATYYNSAAVLTEILYDNYPSGSALSFQSVANLTDPVDTRTKGLKTYEKITSLGGGTAIERRFYYNRKGRLIQTAEKNQLALESRYSNQYDFTGNVTKTQEAHQIAAGQTKTVLTENDYDHRNRLLSTQTTFDGRQAKVEYAYNELGQQIGQEYGMDAGAVPFAPSYAYNIQGWRDKQASAHFAMSLDYFGTGHVSGNIYGIRWHRPSGSSAEERKGKLYRYSYDYLGRLAEAAALPGNYNEKEIRYDRNGNITHLRRTDNSNTLHQWNYNYTGNRLTSLSGVSGTYAYDKNGNMTNDPRKNLNFSYNFLNLVSEVKTGSTVKAKYNYSATGQKLGVKDANGQNGFDYLGSLTLEKTNGSLSVECNFTEGMIKGNTVTYFDRDHLGSVRATVNQNGTVAGINDYYAFGTRHNTGLIDQANRFLFNGKEDQVIGELRLIDFGWRMNDTELGRWFNLDPMLENYYSISPYNFVGNNPVSRIDPNGMFYVETKYFDEDGKLILETDDSYPDRIAIVPNSRLSEFKHHLDYLSESGRNNDGWNNYWVDEFGGEYHLSPDEQAVVNMFHSQSSRNAAIGYMINPSLSNFRRMVGREILAQWTTPELLVAAASMGVLAGGSTKPTAHGTTRIAGKNATRGGVLSSRGVSQTKKLGRSFTQADGGIVYLHEVSPGKFNAVVENANGALITTMENWSQSSINRIATNYGWNIK